MVESIIYAMRCKRPDLSSIVAKLSQNLSNQRPSQLLLCKHAFLIYHENN